MPLITLSRDLYFVSGCMGSSYEDENTNRNQYTYHDFWVSNYQIILMTVLLTTHCKFRSAMTSFLDT